MTRGIDISNYQSQFSAADADAMKRAGYGFVFIGQQWRNVWKQQQAQFCRDAGVKVAAYIINIGGTWPELDADVRYVAVDVEPGSEFTDEAAIDNAVEWVRFVGREPVIYSSNWAWNALGLRSLTKYGEQGLLLWNAHYDGQADNFNLSYPFGGWTRCDIDQYTEHGRIDGIDYDLDLNAARDGLFDPPPIETFPIEEEDDVEIKELDQGETVAALESVARSLGMALNDQNGITVVEVTAGSPKPVPVGGRAILFITRD